MLGTDGKHLACGLLGWDGETKQLCCPAVNTGTGQAVDTMTNHLIGACCSKQRTLKSIATSKKDNNKKCWCKNCASKYIVLVEKLVDTRILHL